MKSRRGLQCLLLLAAVGCQTKKKPAPRTEPWPAPVASTSSAPGAAAQLSYVIDSSVVRVELPARKKQPRGTLSQVDGRIAWDPARPERVRAEIRVDLLSLSLGFGDDGDPELVSRALDWLELSSLAPPEKRERERYAVLRISACDRPAAQEEQDPRRPLHCTARGDLTLHRFRVPVAVDVAVTVEKDSHAVPTALVIRTRRPLVVPLARYDIQPRSRDGELLPAEFASVGNEVGREARISAELRARLTESTDKP